MAVCVASVSQKELVGVVKSALVKAWRERWSDMHWGVQLRQILTTFPQAGETTDLADVLLQQALVGPNPNKIVLSFLRHAVCTHVIRYSAVFDSIVKYEDINKHYCVVGLIGLAEEFLASLSFDCGAEAALNLAKSLQSLSYWFLTCILKRLQDNKQMAESLEVMECAVSALQRALQQPSVCSLLYIARMEESDTYRLLEQAEVDIRGTLSQLPQGYIPNPLKEKISETFSLMDSVQEIQVDNKPVLDLSDQPVCSSLNGLVSLEAVLNPTNNIQPFVEQLFVIKKLQKMSRSDLCRELFRACYMGLIDSTGKHEERKWAAFTFLKLPQVLIRVKNSFNGRDFSEDLEKGIDDLLNYTPILDLTDTKCNCDCLQILLGECHKHGLLSELQWKKLMQRRTSESQKTHPVEPPIQQPSASLILRAEPTVTSIMKTLDADFSKNQDALLGVLSHMSCGKSFELILAAAAATGNLQGFSVKLVRLNEFAKQSSGETGKGALNRSLLFDISFLMLCHITQIYGTEILSCSADCMESFFVKWAVRCLPDEGKYKSIDNSGPTDSLKLDSLLSQMYVGGEIKTSLQKWNEVCMNAPFAVQEVLFAWEQGVIPAENVKVTLDNVKSRMCCLPIVVSAWLCSYINTVGEEGRAKPLSMLQQLLKTIQPDPTNQYYNERSHLMVSVLRKMTSDILPAAQTLSQEHLIPAKTLPNDALARCLRTVFSQGWLDLTSLHTLEQILNLCGSDWLCDQLVRHMLEGKQPIDLTRALSMAFSAFHIDLEPLTLSLLLHTLPTLLQSSHRIHLLIDPRGYTLAKLCVMCISSAYTAKTAHKDCVGYARRGRKRSRKDVDLEDLEESESRPSKQRRIQDPAEITFHLDGYNLDLITPKEDGEMSPTYDTRDPLNKALVNLFRMLNAVSKDSQVGPRTSFTVAFIDEAIRCGPKFARYILQFMPPQMMSHLMKMMPEAFSDQHVLNGCDLSSRVGRKVAAKAICQNTRYHRRKSSAKAADTASLT
ncbi:mediator of RNA polymerase II transcription subunit 24-like isoform X2 [Liolophura sinensis]|uniref:mediator of RNA polymerase II transcription subunit 24-like isoform X2 n=1 Tax=Liolophura sinensis TaxID=3198878 RepID=UPI00315960B1